MQEIWKTKIGKTPIFRARKLEKELGIGRIFLKMEGNNPTGHRADRLARLNIREAMAGGVDTVCIGTYGTTGASLCQLAKNVDLQFVFVVPMGAKVVRKKLLQGENIIIIEYGRTYTECVYESKRLSKHHGWYDANPGSSNNMTAMCSFSDISRELHVQMKEKPVSTVFCQTANGSSVAGVYLGFKQLWLENQIEAQPRIFGVGVQEGNALIESFREGRDIIKTIPKEKKFKTSNYNRHMICRTCFNGQDALNALHDCKGDVIGLTTDELLEMGRWFNKLEKVRFSLQNAYPIAALIKEARAGRLEEGNHIVIMNDGKVDITIEELKREELPMSYDDFLAILDKWLVQFSDPAHEMREAVDIAFDEGTVLAAYDGQRMLGLTILTRTRFQDFFPSLHLSYIAVDGNVKGLGIATQLIQRAIEISGGHLSLHVEVDNPRAIRLYKKMGFKAKYFRMIYQDDAGEE